VHHGLVELARPDADAAQAAELAAPAPQLVALAYAAIVTSLVVGGFLALHRHSESPLGLISLAVAVVVAGVATAAILVASARARRVLSVVGIAGMAVAAVALGAAGHPEAGVIVGLPVTWLLGTEAEVGPALGAPLAAGAAGTLAYLLVGRTALTPLATVAAAALVGVWIALAGQAFGRRVTAAATERDSLHHLRTEMVTTVSHELRTPLTVIQGATATLNRRWDVLSEAERLDLIDVLTENVASLDASILHFVDAARLERGEVVLAPGWVDVATAISAASARRMAALAGHEIRTDLAVRAIWADPTALERILEHLLMNAARFSPIGLPITVRTTAGSGDVTLAVVDKGQGIAPHLLATVWEPLQRGDVSETGISRGAGLGLPIVRELARLHGGEATLRSWRGRGTTVTVTLPQPPGAPLDVSAVAPATGSGLTTPMATPDRRPDPAGGDGTHRGALSRRVS
jgi:signal transduction histidine kinase